jgi:phosphopantothenate---cysteine ligase (CTP)
MNILITGGGCREPVDGVRCITNMSTGKTSASIAAFFAEQGALVTSLTAARSVQAETKQEETGSIQIKTYETAIDLSVLLRQELTEHSYDAVIHAAAVSDFLPAAITVHGKTVPAGKHAGKIPSGTQMTVSFEPAPKIAPQLRAWAEEGNTERKTVIVCFKLTDGADRTARLRASGVLLKNNTADYVVSNDITELKGGMHPFELFGTTAEHTANPVSVCSGKTTEELAQVLYAIIRKKNTQHMDSRTQQSVTQGDPL